MLAYSHLHKLLNNYTSDTENTVLFCPCCEAQIII